jgi:hypothetical protein
MKKYVVFLLAFLFLLTLQPNTAAGHSIRAGFSSRGFVTSSGHPIIVSSGRPQFISPSVIIINSSPARVVRVTPFAHEFINSPRRHFVGNTLIIQEPFFCFGHSIGFINEASFVDHLHRFHGIPFETIPTVVVHSGPQVFFFGE